MLAHDRHIRELHGQSTTTIERFRRFVEGTGIHTRHYAHQHWLPAETEPGDLPEHAALSAERDIFTPTDFAPSYCERMSVFGETVYKLAVSAAQRALDDWGGRPEDITHVITTCTSGWNEPGVAVAVMRALDLRLDCQKAKLNFNGCFCGATCLRLARDVVKAGDRRTVLVVAVEVASTHYDVTATDPSSLVAHALFADGAAAMIVSGDGPWRYTDTGMSLVPDSTHLLGLSPPLEAGQSAYRMTLDRRVGKALGGYFAEGPGADLIDAIVAPSNERPALGIHPGGPNILDHVGQAFSDRGWPEGALGSSYDTLQSHGNLGAAAMLFVLSKRLGRIEEDRLVTMAFGPGVTVEWASLEQPARMI
jgi:predicted naringenin-chalcone synthase